MIVILYIQMSRLVTCTAVSLIKPWKLTCVEVITSVMQSAQQRMNCFYCFPMMYQIMLSGKLKLYPGLPYRVGFSAVGIGQCAYIKLCVHVENMREG